MMRDEIEDDGINDPVNFLDNTANADNDLVNDPINLKNGIVNSVDDIVNGIVNDIVNKKKTIEQAVFEIITQKEGLSASDIAKIIGKSWRTTMRYLDILKREDKIEFRGAPKTGGYYLKS
jgi:ATP-dependent DNA helicase RecG